jgi:membrane-bound serine protease (ClpP class)
MRIEMVWPILTLIVALLLFLSEAFIPSGGLIGLMAIGFLGVSLYLAFTTTAYGWAFLIVTGLLLPITLVAAVSIWPRTPIGKMLTLNPPDPDAAPDADDLRLDPMVGQFGRCLTPLRPTGLIDFDGRKLEGSAEDGLLPAGTLVRIIQVRGSRVIVRKAEIPAFDESTS